MVKQLFDEHQQPYALVVGVYKKHFLDKMYMIDPECHDFYG